MLNVFSTIILILFFSPFLISCTKTDVKNSGSVSRENVIQNVPFVKQKYRFCGPAALTSVFRYYGLSTDQDEIAESVYTPELNGSLISDMKHYAEENGFRAFTDNGNIDKLLLLIDQKTPVILLVDKGKLGVNIQHYYVVYGYNPQKNSFTIHDGRKSGREIGSGKLDGEWKKMNRFMLVINNEN
ncbi:MAG: cysteine peptidase family C39 domain-containing protein [Thermodesulfobacteriota bacterium]